VGRISNEGSVEMIAIGADTHKRSHTLVAVDAATGAVRGQLTIAAADEGTLDALRFAACATTAISSYASASAAG
jgi:hypothetical protein